LSARGTVRDGRGEPKSTGVTVPHISVTGWMQYAGRSLRFVCVANRGF
jgi:hypothetical protein